MRTAILIFLLGILFVYFNTNSAAYQETEKQEEKVVMPMAKMDTQAPGYFLGVDKTYTEKVLEGIAPPNDAANLPDDFDLR